MPLDDNTTTSPESKSESKAQSASDELELAGRSGQAKLEQAKGEGSDGHVEPVSFERETIAPNVNMGSRILAEDAASGAASGGDDAAPAQVAATGSDGIAGFEEGAQEDGSSGREIPAVEAESRGDAAGASSEGLASGPDSTGRLYPAGLVDLTGIFPSEGEASAPADYSETPAAAEDDANSDGLQTAQAATLDQTPEAAPIAPLAVSLDNASVDENSADGTVVGQVTGAGGQGAYSYTLLNDGGGRFVIDANTGVITVANGSLLDHEALDSSQIVVEVTDGRGISYSETFDIAIADVNEGPSDLDLTGGTIVETAGDGAAVGSVAVTDEDQGDSHSYSLTDNAGGRFAIDANTGVITVADGSLLDYETATSHQVTVRVTDAGGLTHSETYTVNLTDDTGEAQVSAIADSDGSGNTVSESAANGATVGVTALASDADSTDSVTYSLTDNAGGRFAIDANTGVITVADGSLLDYETATSHGVTVKATSSDGSTSTQSFTVNLSDDTGEAQVSAIADSDGGANTVSESAANGATVGVTALASDADGTDSVTYSLTDNAGGRFAIDANTGVITVADGSLLDYETATSHGVTVKATSSDGSTSTQSFTVNLSDDTGEAQVSAIADSDGGGNTVSESAANGATVGVSALASDADGTDSVTYSLADNAGGRFTIDANTGVITVADGSLLDYETATSHGVTVKATSSDGSTSTQSFTVNLSDDTGEAQVSAIADSDGGANTVSESAANGATVGVTALASDADGTDSVTYSLADNAGGRFAIDANSGVITVADGSLLDYETATSHGVTVKATSSDGSTSTQSFTVNLSDDTGEAQVSAIADSDGSGNTVSESAANGATVGVTALASDADSTDSVTYSLTDNAGGRFAIDANTGVITVADGSLLDYETATSHGVTVKATSSDGSTSTQSFTVNLSDDTGEAQVSAIADSDGGANTVSESAANGATVGVTALASDADGTDSVTYSLADNAGGRFAIDANSGVITVADGSLLDYETATSHGVTVKATSSDGSTSTQSFTVNLSDDTGEAQVSAIADSDGGANTVSESAANGATVGVSALASDADGTDSVTYSLADNAGGRFTIDANTGVITVADGSLLDYETATSHGVTVKATSSDGSTSTQSFTVNLSDDTGEAQVSAIADSDGSGNTVSESAANGATVGVTALASDADGTDSVTYSLADNAGGRFAIDANTGVITVADGSLLDYETATSHGVTVKATSSDGSTSTQSFTVNLSDDTGEAQVSAIADSDGGANTVSESAANGATVGVTALASDADGTDSVTYSLADNAGGRFAIDANTGVITVADGSLLDYETATSHGVTVKATSSDGSTSTQSFTVNLSDDTGEAQVSAIADSDGGANTVSESAANGATVGVTALASDADGTDSVTYSLADNAGGRFAIDANSGVITVADGSLLDYETATSHGVTVKATSSDGSTSTQSFTVNLSDDTGEAQVSAIADSDGSGNTVSESAANGATVGVTALASDADSTDSVTYSLTDNAGGRFAIDANSGVITVADGSLLDYETATSHGVTVKATSSDGSTSTQSFTVNLSDDTGEAQVSAIADSDGSGNTVSESAANGATVGVTALASDADSTDSVTYSLTDNAGGRFAIDANTGVITVADGSLLDYETATSHGVTVKATSSDGSTSTQSFTVNLSDDTGEAQVSAIADSDGSGNTVSESAANGATVGVTALASDADGTDSVTYSLSDNAGGRFAIDANTGVITVADGSLLDYETATSHGVTVKATSSDGSTSTQSFTVNLSDDTGEAQVSAIADSDGGANTVSESAANGATVGVTALASDADGTDSVTYSLADNAGGRFAIDANTGVITVADGSLLDYETATSHGVTVKATSSDGSTSTQSFTVNLSDDTGEAQVSAIADSDGGANTVSESAANGATVGVTALATDADGTDSVTYSLADNAGGRFAIDANSGVITVADGSLLDYETATSHGVTVKATSSDGSTSTQSFTVNLSDDTGEAQVSAIADSNATGNSVAEGAANGTAVGVTALATDADGTDGVTYSLSNNAGGRFAIDANTGVITVANGSLLDYETATSHGVTVKATSSDGSTSTQSFTIAVGDQVETITGTPNEDSLVGGSGSDVIDALGDDDKLYGGGAADTLFGGAGNDSLYGGDGDDVLEGGAGADTLVGGSGSDTASYANSSSGVIVDLGSGDNGSKSENYVNLVNSKNPTAYWRLQDGGHGNTAVDSVGGHNGTHERTGSSYADPFGESGVGSSDFDGSGDYVTVPYSNDFNMSTATMQLWFRPDSVTGSDKTLFALSGGGGLNATLAIDNGQIQLAANYGGYPFEVKAGSVTANEWHHVALSWNGSQVQVMLDGVTIVDLPQGAPVVGGGASIVIGANSSGNNAFDGLISEVAFHDEPIWESDSQEIYQAGINGTDAMGDTYSGIENVEGTAYSDTLTGDAGDNILYGGGGDDTLFGEDGSNTLYGGDGNDVLDDIAGSNLAGGNTYYGGAGDDRMWSGDAADTQYGGDGNDTLSGEGGDDLLYGGNGADSLYGSVGDDDLFGGAGSDLLYGGSGSDLLNGGAGDDQLYGGDGSDLFIFQEGGGSDSLFGGTGGGWTDTIELQDASGGSDIGAFGSDWTISLNQGSIQSQGADHLVLSNDAAGTITLEDGSQISFEGVERVEW